MAYVNIHLLHHKSTINAYKIDHIGILKHILKDAVASSGNLGVFLKMRRLLRVKLLRGMKKLAQISGQSVLEPSFK